MVVHAPSDRRVKGTHYVLEAVDRLQRSGIAVELRLVEGLTRDAAVPLYADGDVFVDQLIAGWYGGAAVEAMALGRPVIAFIREDDLSLIPEAMRDELPVVNATPETIDGSLRKLVEATAEERRRREGGRGRTSSAGTIRSSSPRTCGMSTPCSSQTGQ